MTAIETPWIAKCNPKVWVERAHESRYGTSK